MPIIYNGNKLIPAPLISISKNYDPNKTVIRNFNANRIASPTYDITLNGFLLANKGSPNSSGQFWTLSDYPPDEALAHDSQLASLLKKQEAIRGLFATEGQLLEIQPWDGTAPTKCNPRIVSLTFPEGNWVGLCQYSINLQADVLYGPLYAAGEDNVGQFLNDSSETWEINLAEGANDENYLNTYNLTHTVNAVGRRSYDVNGVLLKEPWEMARDWVQGRTGYDATRAASSGALNVPSYYTGFNHVKTESVDRAGGSYGITETWTLSSGNALEDFSINVQSGTDDGLVRVSINGTIQGLETRNTDYSITEKKYTAAQARWPNTASKILTRAQNYAGVGLNPRPLNTTVGHSPIAGTITYDYSYDNRPSNLITNALYENIEISDTLASQVFAVIPILGRAAGPLLQDIGTVNETRRSLSIECTVPPVFTNTYAAWTAGKPDVSAITGIVRPVATQVFKAEDTENWNPKTGKYSRNVSWVYQ